MIRRGFFFFIASLLAIVSQTALRADPAADSLNFNEVYNLIRTNAEGVTEADLNRAAIQGLISALSPKVSIVTNNAANANAEAISKVNLFDNVAYLRITRIDSELPKAISDTYRAVNATNKLSGLVLDLRFTESSDYAGAAATADIFTTKAVPLLNWGTGSMSSHQKANAITEPIAVLVNHETAGAAEALAEALREVGAGLILGSRTAGRALVTRDFPLKNGSHLRIATASVVLGNNSPISLQGVKPDIDVTISVEDEKSFYADAFLIKTNAIASVSSTNQVNGTNQAAARRFRLNEAELVRARKQGIDLDALEEGVIPAHETHPDVPVVRDPALARALDLLKGLALVRQSRS